MSVIVLDIFQTGLTSIVIQLIDLYELVKVIPGNWSDIYCTYITSQNTAICTPTRAVVAPSSVPSLEHTHTQTHPALYQSRTHTHTHMHTHTHTHTHAHMYSHAVLYGFRGFLTGKNKITADTKW